MKQKERKFSNVYRNRTQQRNYSRAIWGNVPPEINQDLNKRPLF